MQKRILYLDSVPNLLLHTVVDISPLLYQDARLVACKEANKTPISACVRTYWLPILIKLYRYLLPGTPTQGNVSQSSATYTPPSRLRTGRRLTLARGNARLAVLSTR